MDDPLSQGKMTKNFGVSKAAKDEDYRLISSFILLAILYHIAYFMLV